MGLGLLQFFSRFSGFLSPMTESELYTITRLWPLTLQTPKVGSATVRHVPHSVSSAPWKWCTQGEWVEAITARRRECLPHLLPLNFQWKTFTQPGHRALLVSYPRRKKGLEAGLDGVGPLIGAWAGYPSALWTMSHCCQVQGACWLLCHLLCCLPDLPVFNSTGVLLTQNGSQVSANFDGTVTISVIALSNILHASSSLSEEYRNHTEGLLGKKQSSDNTKAATPPTDLGLPCPAQFFLSPLGHREGMLNTLF